MKIRVALLVVSDRVYAGTMEDLSGAAAEECLVTRPEIDVIERDIVPDEQSDIEQKLTDWCEGRADVVFTLGGTGFSPRDVTPEATRRVIEREAPGIACALLANGLEQTPRAMFSRAAAGLRSQTLIVNLPGKPKAVRESLDFLLDHLPHAIEMIHGGGHPDEEL